MSTKPIQIDSYVKNFMTAYPHNPKTLLVSAYVEEEQRWKLALSAIYKEIENCSGSLNILIEKEKKLQKSFWRLLWRRFTGKNKNKNDVDEMIRLSDILKLLQDKYIKLLANPPDQMQYTLALMGSNIFSPR